MELTAREWNHIGEYAEAKGVVLQKILEKGVISAEDRENIRRANAVGLIPPKPPGWSRQSS